MKFSLFIHMERLVAGPTDEELYHEYVELCKIADAGGFSTIWTGEHHGMNFTISPNPLLYLVDLSHVTKNVRLGTGTIIAPFWHPIRVAGEVAAADHMVNGRLEVGIARGAYNFEYERLSPGLDAWTAGQKLREMIPAIKKLWIGDYTHNGEFWKFPSTTSSPKPLQQPHPPLWIAARDPNSHEFAVANGCNVQCLALWNGDEEVRNLMGRFRAAQEKYPDNKSKIMLLQHTYVADCDADKQQAAKELSRYYNYFLAWAKNKSPIHQGLVDPLTEEDMAQNTMVAPEVMLNNLSIGTADEVIAKLKNYEKLGFDEYSFWIDSGMTFERKKASLERFIKDVIPAFGAQ